MAQFEDQRASLPKPFQLPESFLVEIIEQIGRSYAPPTIVSTVTGKPIKALQLGGSCSRFQQGSEFSIEGALRHRVERFLRDAPLADVRMVAENVLNGGYLNRLTKNYFRNILKKRPDNELRSALEKVVRSNKFFFQHLKNLLIAEAGTTPANQEDINEVAQRLARKFFEPGGIAIGGSDPRKNYKELLLTSGSSVQPFLASVLAMSEPGDVVLFGQGTFEALPTVTVQRQRKAIILPGSEDTFQITAEGLEQYLSKTHGKERPKILVLVNPSGVFGNYYPRRELEAIAKVCVRYNLRIISDELYTGLGNHSNNHQSCSFASLTCSVGEQSYRMHDRTVTIHGTSKITPFPTLKCALTTCGDRNVLKKLRESLKDWQPCIRTLVLHSAFLDRYDAIQSSQGKQYKEAISYVTRALQNLNRRIPGHPFSIIIDPDTGFYVGLAGDAGTFAEVGVHSSKDFRDYLLETCGIHSRELSTMYVGSVNESVVVRLNVADLTPNQAQTFSGRLARLSKRLLSRTAPIFEKHDPILLGLIPLGVPL